uniref:uncharacterized protein LOC101605274 n=1 Tax=Jaculus jaculus TaxID=51337 RepID=UPI001E1B5883|nr:uncharacterized protein LOC101605274 [Jaculus jaculus]
MRLLCVLFFLGNLLSTSHAHLEDSRYEAGSGEVDITSPNYQEHVDPEDNDSGEYTEVSDQPSQSTLLSGTSPDVTPDPFKEVTVNTQNTVSELVWQEISDLDSPDTALSGGLDNMISLVDVGAQGEGTVERAVSLLNQQLSTLVINQDFLAQEGLLVAIIVNSQKLLTERERLLKILLGSNNLLNDTDDLLQIAGPLALEGLLCKGPLGGLCGHGSLTGMNDVLKNMSSGKLNTWLSITSFHIVQVSGRFLVSSHNQLKLQTKMSINFPGVLSFLSSSSVDVNIMAPFEMQQPKPGQVLFVLKDCRPIVTGIHMHAGVLTKQIQWMLKWTLNISLPNILCPVVRFWFHIINQQWAVLSEILSFNLLETVNSPVSPVTLPPEQHYSLDFKDKNFPASFISWLIKSKFSFSPPPSPPLVPNHTSLFCVEHPSRRLLEASVTLTFPDKTAIVEFLKDVTAVIHFRSISLRSKDITSGFLG